MDYEIYYYRVEYKKLYFGRIRRGSTSFHTEEEALNWIIEYKENWIDYRLIQLRVAILDF